MRKRLTAVFLSFLILALAACTGNTGVVTTTGIVSQTGGTLTENNSGASSSLGEDATLSTTPSADFDSDDLLTQAGSQSVTTIQLNGEEIDLQGSGAAVQGTTATITEAGTYQISGELDDGQLVINSAGEGVVHLILDGAEIHSSTSGAILIESAEKTVITLAEGSQNALLDGETRSQEEEQVNAALFSKDDLTINGSGSLAVTGSYNHGIVSKDDLKIASGSLSIEAVNDGIKGKDSIAILDGEISISAGGDGMQAYNQSDPDKGIVVIEGGSIEVNAGEDGIQAETALTISGGDFQISSGGGSANGAAHWEGMDRQADFGETTLDTGGSAKGLKAGVLVHVSGGTFSIDAADDAIHTNGTIAISGGKFQLASGDDGMHADSSLEISGGEIQLETSYEGLESAQIILAGGSLHLVSSDDGINGSTGNGGGQGGPGMGEMGGGDSSLTISDGTIYVDAGGDGIDVNGPIQMSGGTVLVNGPTNNGNGALDYTGEFIISGGVLIAAGSSGMAQAPSESSSQASLLYNFESALPAGTPIHLESQGGQEILTFVPAKQYQSVVISTPDLTLGQTYQLFSGGSSSGSLVDGLYTGGTYSGGDLVAAIDLTSQTTSAGAQGGFMGGPGGGGGRPPHTRGN